MERTPENNMALVSAVLFLESTPVDESYLAKVTGLDLDDVVLALNQLCTQTSLANLGFEPIKSGGGWVLAPKVEIWEELK
ncbi:MAG TPA: SMC-Scp complex subunit ScpB, partial [Spirochaetales bacterium]|nr:SMC-Scp complex subunit ScpB [Spirochaetales bacterium]